MVLLLVSIFMVVLARLEQRDEARRAAEFVAWRDDYLSTLRAALKRPDVYEVREEEQA